MGYIYLSHLLCLFYLSNMAFSAAAGTKGNSKNFYPLNSSDYLKIQKYI